MATAEVSTEMTVPATPASSEADPRSFLGQLRDEFDHLYGRLARSIPHIWPTKENNWPWAFDIEDRAETVVVRAEAPGVDPANINVQVGDGRLQVRAARYDAGGSCACGCTKGQCRCAEGNCPCCAEGKCQCCAGGKCTCAETTQRTQYWRSVSVASPVDWDRVEARLRNGLLTVTLPKSTECKIRAVPVQIA